MAKGNSGGTRTSSSSAPTGLREAERNSQPNNIRTREVEREIADYENGIEELRAQQQDLFDEEDRLGREMARDPENQEYYENQIMDLDREIDEIDHEIQTYRIRIDRLKQISNR